MGGIVGLTLLAAGTLIVDVGNVRSAKGMVHIDVCGEATFLKADCPRSAEAPARPGTVSVTVPDLPAGLYAIQAYQDENGNHDVDRGLFGLPKEGIGFSRDARVRLGPPKWADARFAFDGIAGRQALKLRYFLGPPGPDPAR